ncbi:hypothetical protein FB480_103422 [Agrobacterium vitis]|nr:hypothetical protein FB480_103422 [Agrobacterium vitis]
MADKPILFSGPMVRALLDDRKTQTRRIFTPPPPFDFDDDISVQVATGAFNTKYQVGDRLWVKETWQGLTFGDFKPTKHEPCELRFAATDPCADLDAKARGYTWRPSIFMPRWASRITLTVTDVRIERLQDISEADAIAEGIHKLDGPLIHYGTDADSHYATNPKQAYAILWNSINTKPKPVTGGDGKISHFESFPWDGTRRTETHRGKPHYIYPNPWVAAYTFRVIKQNIDQIKEVG